MLQDGNFGTRELFVKIRCIIIFENAIEIKYISLKTFFSAILLFLSCIGVTQENDYLPQVFQIGEYTTAYEKLHLDHLNLMEVCDDNMELAYEKWMHMLNAMDVYSEDLGVDIKGVKLWLHVFWNNEGQIAYLAFHPKPTSKHMNNNELMAFFKNFVRDYMLPLKTDKKYMHYGSAAFPTLATRLALKRGKN